MGFITYKSFSMNYSGDMTIMTITLLKRFLGIPIGTVTVIRHLDDTITKTMKAYEYVITYTDTQPEEFYINNGGTTFSKLRNSKEVEVYSTAQSYMNIHQVCYDNPDVRKRYMRKENFKSLDKFLK